MKKHLTTIILILAIILGVSLLLYPTVSDYWNSLRQTRAIAGYVDAVNDMDAEKYAQIWTDAISYNAALAKSHGSLILTDEEREVYKTTLNITGNGIMGYIDIPAISCHLPIYHGVGDSVLQIAVGHMEGSSLPTGGESTHCVLSGHRGLPSAMLFTDLDKISVGDVFTINVLNETLTYEVYDILTVLPHEVDGLKIEKGKDLCTLVTCTPYGVNSHRLLVKAQRTENAEEAVKVHIVSEASKIAPAVVAPVLAAPILLALLIMLFVNPKKGKNKGNKT